MMSSPRRSVALRLPTRTFWNVLERDGNGRYRNTHVQNIGQILPLCAQDTFRVTGGPWMRKFQNASQ